MALSYPHWRRGKVFDFVLASTTKKNNLQDQAEQEVSAGTPLLETTAPLLWWKVNQDRFQHLAQIAQKILSIPATSTTPERMFSASGQRAALSAENVNFILLLNKNTAFSKDPSEPTESEGKLPNPCCQTYPFEFFQELPTSSITVRAIKINLSIRMSVQAKDTFKFFS